MSVENPVNDTLGTTAPASFTLATLLTDFDDHVASSFSEVREIGLKSLGEAEGELRRGLIAMNGAGLLAVVSLLAQKLDPLVLRAAAAIFFLGVCFALLGWLDRARSFRNAWRAQAAFKGVFDEIKAAPLSRVPLTTPEEFDAAQKGIHKAIDTVGEALKRPGKRAEIWTYAAAAAFVGATLILLVNFEASAIPTPATNVPNTRAAAPTTFLPIHHATAKSSAESGGSGQSGSRPPTNIPPPTSKSAND